MEPRFAGRFSLADSITLLNAALGFLAVIISFDDPSLGARLILLAAIADGLDGIVARYMGGSEIGPYLDSLADTVSFGVAPAVLVYSIFSNADIAFGIWQILTYAVPMLFVAAVVTRLALYTVYDIDDAYTVGVPSTLASTVISAGVLTSFVSPEALLGLTAVFCYLMIIDVDYPDLLPRDALLMGAIQVLAILVPTAFSGIFPIILLLGALAYLVFGPILYWR
ncbi:protein sorting system archaetidylserine synthase [Salinarchaeum sp. IM2453]|uniref:protein sorting system archaetidylserine synthase n=1 Tax=Salinarchaeum sp. IM2453 TaxID=2862870 RepID=UPI001C829E9F|nr:protein sorting system archaetidylserine synthase [Salinarchaeum sp. IM2453]QZA88615.1 protein sorting system archaetidylserine synthase [Salinarchaeum sp. IM2453]